MRPIVVFALVIVAVGALIFAILTTGSPESQETEPAAASRGGAAGQVAAERNQTTLEGGTPDRAEPTTAETAPRIADVREGIEGAPATSFGSAIEGKITAPDGSPVAQAKVQLQKGAAPPGLRELQILNPTSQRPEDVWTKYTDDEGMYRIDGLPPGKDYAMVVSAQGFAPAERPMIQLRPDETTREDLQLDEGFAVVGTVTDVGGGPIADAELSMLPVMAASLAQGKPSDDAVIVTSDATGSYRFPNVPPGARSITVRAEGYGSVTANNINVMGETLEIVRDFELEPGTFLAGRVVSRSQQPIRNALVRAISYDSANLSQGTTETDASGAFRIEGLASGQYSIITTADGWGVARLNRIEGGDGDVLIEMDEQGAVRGRAIDSSTSEPIGSLTVYVRQVVPNSTTYGRRLRRTEVNDPSGMFEVRGLDEGNYVVEGVAAGYAPTYSESFKVTMGLVTSDIVVRMSKGGIITGRVTSTDGDPIHGAKVQTHDTAFVRHALIDLLGNNQPRNTTSKTMLTDEDGRFEMELLTPEVYQLEVTHPKYTTLIKKDLRVYPDSQKTDVGTLQMLTGGTVRGVVYDGSGEALAGLTVTLTTTDQGRVANYQARTNGKGRYVVENVSPGAYRLHAARPANPGDPFAQILDMTNSRVDISVYDSRETVQDLNLGG